MASKVFGPGARSMSVNDISYRINRALANRAPVGRNNPIRSESETNRGTALGWRHDWRSGPVPPARTLHAMLSNPPVKPYSKNALKVPALELPEDSTLRKLLRRFPELKGVPRSLQVRLSDEEEGGSTKEQMWIGRFFARVVLNMLQSGISRNEAYATLVASPAWQSMMEEHGNKAKDPANITDKLLTLDRAVFAAEYSRLKDMDAQEGTNYAAQYLKRLTPSFVVV